VLKLRDIAASIRSIDLPPIIRAAPRLPLKLLFEVRLTTSTWDEKRGGFPMASSAIPYGWRSFIAARLPEVVFAAGELRVG
jgi:hypothetical protein